jgi:CRP-like cAMP-binding protein
MTNPLIRQLQSRDPLSVGEKQVLERAIARIEQFNAGRIIVQAGSRPNETSLVVEGLACRYKSVAGYKRQITAFHVPGDFVDLYGFILKRVDHTVAALTPCKVAFVPHETLHDIVENHPRLGRLLWLCTLVEGAAHREWVASMGNLPASARMAHLLCELYIRLKAVGQTDGTSFRLPLTQAKIGEALGLSYVHVNRVLQQLRAEELIIWRQETVTIADWKRLCRVGHFDPSYLYLRRELH